MTVTEKWGKSWFFDGHFVHEIYLFFPFVHSTIGRNADFTA